jgi:methionyl aminopeptidase
MTKIILKSKKEIEIMKKGGQIAASVLNQLKYKVKPGITTKSLDKYAEELIRNARAIASFKNFHNYPASVCISVNKEVVHGIPSDRILKEGDIVGIDLGILYQGYHTDTAMTCGVGKISIEAQKLINTTQKALEIAIIAVRPGNHLSDIGYTIQSYVEKEGYSVVRTLVGHGIGHNLQEEPAVPNYGKKGQGIVLKEGMTIAIEPMINVGKHSVKILKDGWTVVTADKSLSAHFEHTIAITKNSPIILTK